jgi:KipI family sensor histidine kinase inhibitor
MAKRCHSPMTSYPRFMPAGDMGLVVELGGDVSLETNARVRALDRLVAEAAIPGVIETLPTNRSVLVVFEPLVVSTRNLERALRALASRIPDAPEEPAGRSWLIPTIYGGDFGIDLAPVAASLGLDEAALIVRHAARDYRVFMIGFQPGFAYLGALDPSLAVSRRDEPRAVIPAGTVSIAGAQTVINSVAAPSGWNLIGRTPVRLFDPDRSQHFLLAAGDLVRFKPVPAEAWAALDARAASGEVLAEALA